MQRLVFADDPLRIVDYQLHLVNLRIIFLVNKLLFTLSGKAEQRRNKLICTSPHLADIAQCLQINVLAHDVMGKVVLAER